jgi:SAM-dependent methyltransferase
MSEEDRQKWNARYREGSHSSTHPSRLLIAAEAWLPRQGGALDLAGGTGRHAIWLAKRGLDVTLADVSDVALAIARQRAHEAGVPLTTRQLDLETEPPPPGPWSLTVLFHYLHRPLFSAIPNILAPGGVLVFVQPTMRNLERHPRPPRPFLLEEGEAPRLVSELEIVRYEEGWLAEGRHDAIVVAKRRN